MKKSIIFTYNQKIIFLICMCFTFFFSYSYASSFDVNRKAISVNEQFDLKQIITDSKNITEYSSSNTSIVNVSNDGILTGISTGTANITIKDNENSSSTLIVTVGYYTGIDISTFNSNINFQKIKEEGIDFLMIRSSYGWYDENDKKSGKDYTFQYDTMLKSNVEGAIKYQIPFGIYHYSYATTVEEAKLEAEYTLNALKYANITPSNISLPIAYDIEDENYQSTIDKETLTDIVIAYCTKIKEVGFSPMIYSNKEWFSKHLNISRLNSLGYDFWYANYTENTSDKITISNTEILPLIWQYSNSGSVNGANNLDNHVDMNVMYMRNSIKITFTQDADIVATKNINKGFYTQFPKLEKEGYIFKGWKYADGTLAKESDIFFNDTTLTAYFEPDLSLKSLSFNITNLILKENSTYSLRTTYFPTNTTDSCTLNFTSSDEQIATVDENRKNNSQTIWKCNNNCYFNNKFKYTNQL